MYNPSLLGILTCAIVITGFIVNVLLLLVIMVKVETTKPLQCVGAVLIFLLSRPFSS